jgi:hypothetical protein
VTQGQVAGIFTTRRSGVMQIPTVMLLARHIPARQMNANVLSALSGLRCRIATPVLDDCGQRVISASD